MKISVDVDLAEVSQSVKLAACKSAGVPVSAFDWSILLQFLMKLLEMFLKKNGDIDNDDIGPVAP